MVLKVKDLTRHGEYQDVSLTIRKGETVGLTGLLGAGRTELALSIFGMTRPDSGRHRDRRAAVRLNSNRDAIRAGIGYVSEDRLSLGLIQPQSIADNIVITVLDKIVEAAADFPAQEARLVATLDRANWRSRSARPDDPISTLSGGNQQRVAIAKWLAVGLKLLILDCPTVGVDVGARAGIFDIVRQLAAEGLAILLISDEVPEVYFNADRVLHMADGRIVGEYDPRQHRARRRLEGRRLCVSIALPEAIAPHPTEIWLCRALVSISVALSLRRPSSSPSPTCSTF